MSTRASFSAEEWDILSALPSQAAIAAAVSDGVTLFGTIREFNAGMQAIEEGAATHAGNELIAAILTDMAEQAEDLAEAERMLDEGGAPPPAEDDVDDLPLEATEPGSETTSDLAEEVVTSSSATDAVAAIGAPDVDPRDPAAFLHEVIANATQAREILAAKTTPDEAGGYTAWVLEVVDRVINRTKSGGFLGIGGERVDDEEADFRADLAAALNA
jgi:hypothetical protein